jgi:FxsC-like protein
MAYDFFLSYTRANNDAFLKKFFDDLSQGIRDLRGLQPTAEVGFFDQRNIELGEQWDDTIVQALQTAPVFLAVASPAYFKSEYCGKEWAMFRNRLRNAAGAAPMPPLLKSVVWISIKDLIAGLPPAVTDVQLTFGDPGAVHNEKGFKHLLKNLQDNTKVYNDLIEALSRQIFDAANEHNAVPPLANVPTLRDVLAAFPAVTPPGVAAVTVASPTGPKHVRLVYVAANPQVFGAARDPEPYRDNGGADWKPFFPDDQRRVHRLVQNYVSNDELDFTSEELPFSGNLLAQVDDAWAKRQIVVLIVDGWTVRWDANARALLQQLDARLDYHWCVFVPYNEHDSVTVTDHAAIEATISNTFDRHVNLAPNPLFFRSNIRSADDLKKNLQDVLTRLKEEIKKRAPVSMPIPAGPGHAVITGPSAQG